MKDKKITRKNKKNNPSIAGNSKYARKNLYLKRHGGFGFQYPEKPWK